MGEIVLWETSGCDMGDIGLGCGLTGELMGDIRMVHEWA